MRSLRRGLWGNEHLTASCGVSGKRSTFELITLLDLAICTCLSLTQPQQAGMV